MSERSPEIDMPATEESLSPPSSDFLAKLEARWSEGKVVCIGLDSERAKLPSIVRVQDNPFGEIFSFNREIIDATAEFALAFKPNLGFYAGQGISGLRALMATTAHIKEFYPDIPIILDAKYGDIGSTNNGYVEFAFDAVGADAVTVHPTLGSEAMKPFLERKDKGVLVLVRTSNRGAGEFQDRLQLDDRLERILKEGVVESISLDELRENVIPAYQYVAQRIVTEWNYNGNCGVVVGATYPDELSIVRGIVGDIPILIPGIGAQGGKAEDVVPVAQNSKGQGMIINSSRGIIFASSGPDFAEAARRETIKLTDEINSYL